MCIHAEREAIDERLAMQETERGVGARFGLSAHAIGRHRRAHLSPALRTVAAQRETAGALSALERLEHLYAKASSVLEAAEGEGKAALSLQAVRELRAVVEAIAKITGELDERPQTNVLNLSTNQEWQQVRGQLMAALAPFDDARSAAVAALEVVPGEVVEP